jgi:hypothetical protein
MTISHTVRIILNQSILLSEGLSPFLQKQSCASWNEPENPRLGNEQGQADICTHIYSKYYIPVTF